MQLYFEANRHYAWRTSCMTISLYCLILHLLQRLERTRTFARATTMTMKCHVKTNINYLFNCGYFVTIAVCSHFPSDWYGRKVVKEVIEISYVAVLCYRCLAIARQWYHTVVVAISIVVISRVILLRTTENLAKVRAVCATHLSRTKTESSNLLFARAKIWSQAI